jgi:hypothetical protein
MVSSIFNGWRMEDVWLDKRSAALAATDQPGRQ